MDQYQLVTVSYHRNGIGGNGFHVVLFVDGQHGLMVANVFEKPGSVAVLNVPLLVEGCIEFAKGNSWRGDRYEHWLREQIRDYEVTARARYVIERIEEGSTL